MLLPPYVEMIHGIAFPPAPVERQFFYRDDLHIWYIYDGTAWISLSSGMIIHGNAWHAPAFATQAALLAHIAATGAPIHGSSVAAAINTLIHRDATGRAQIVNPAVAADIDNLSARDAAIVLAITIHAALTTGVHGVGASTVDSVAARAAAIAAHAALTGAGVHGSTIAATFNRLVHRDAAGRAKIVNPAVNADIDNLGARDAAIAAHAALPTVHQDAPALIAAHAALTTGVHGLLGELIWYAYKTATQSINTLTLTKVTWQAERFDTGRDFNLVTNEYVAPCDCKVFAYAQLRAGSLTANNDYWRFYFRRNGGTRTILQRYYHNLGYQHTGMSIIEELSAGDSLEVWAYHNSGVAENITSNDDDTFFFGFVIPQST